MGWGRFQGFSLWASREALYQRIPRTGFTGICTRFCTRTVRISHLGWKLARLVAGPLAVPLFWG